MQRVVAGAVGTGFDARGAPDRPDDSNGSNQEREDNAFVPEARVAQDHRRDDGHFVAFEDVGGHARAVADVVADVVRDRRCITRVVLGDARLNLADKIRPNVRRLRIDAAADPHEECEERSAEPETEKDLVGVLAIGHEDDRSTEETESVGQHSRDRACAVAKLKCRAVAGACGGRDSKVAANGKAHAYITDEPGEDAPMKNASALPKGTGAPPSPPVEEK